MTSQNAIKHGYYCRCEVLADAKAYRAFEKSQRRQAGGAGCAAAVGPPVGED